MRHPSLSALLLAAATLAFSSLALTACSPEPAPTPTPTGFSSDDEAFRAAEATYRAYVAAVNARRVDAESVPAPESFLSGAALESSRNASIRFAKAGVSLVGETRVSSVSSLRATSHSVTLTFCIDSSGTKVVDPSGRDVTPPNRESVGSLDVDFVWTPSTPLISDSQVGSSAC